MAGYTLQSHELQSRLAKIEGQVRGVQRMIESDRYCIDVLTQIASIRRALDAVSMSLIDAHVRGCVAGAATSDPDLADARLDEALDAVHRLLRVG